MKFEHMSDHLVGVLALSILGMASASYLTIVAIDWIDQRRKKKK